MPDASGRVRNSSQFQGQSERISIFRTQVCAVVGQAVSCAIAHRVVPLLRVFDAERGVAVPLDLAGG